MVCLLSLKKMHGLPNSLHAYALLDYELKMIISINRIYYFLIRMEQFTPQLMSILYSSDNRLLSQLYPKNLNLAW